MKNVLIATLIIIAMAATVNAAVPTPVSHWAFDGNLNDSGSYGNNGTAVGDPQYVEGRIGQALQFDGDGDGVDIPNESDYDGTAMAPDATFSVAFWAKVDKGERFYGSIFSKIDYPVEQTGGDADKGKGWDLGCNPLAYGEGVSLYGYHPGGRYEFANYYSTLNDGKWHHYVLSIDSTTTPATPTRSFYIDGVQIQSGAGTWAWNNELCNDTPVSIGYNYSRPGVWDFDGAIDDVQFFDYDIDATEAGDLFDAAGGACDGYEADIDGDCDVDIDDLGLLAEDWLECGKHDGVCP